MSCGAHTVADRRVAARMVILKAASYSNFLRVSFWIRQALRPKEIELSARFRHRILQG